MNTDKIDSIASFETAIEGIAAGKLDLLKKYELSNAVQIVFDAINSTVDAIVITDMAGSIIYVNSAFLTMFEYENRSEILGKNAADLFATAEVKKFSDVKAIIDNVKGETEEFSVLRKNGFLFNVEVKSSNVKSSDGQSVGRMASFIDITAKKQNEMDRERLINKLQAALEQIKTLRGILPICSFCKNIRNDKGYYEQIEEYFHKNSGVDFSHTVCPKCIKEHYPEYESITKNKSNY